MAIKEFSSLGKPVCWVYAECQMMGFCVFSVWFPQCSRRQWWGVLPDVGKSRLLTIRLDPFPSVILHVCSHLPDKCLATAFKAISRH